MSVCPFFSASAKIDRKLWFRWGGSNVILLLRVPKNTVQTEYILLELFFTLNKKINIKKNWRGEPDDHCGLHLLKPAMKNLNKPRFSQSISVHRHPWSASLLRFWLRLRRLLRCPFVLKENYFWGGISNQAKKLKMACMVSLFFHSLEICLLLYPRRRVLKCTQLQK